MRALLLVAHGSRLPSSNDTVVELVQKLRPQLSSFGFDAITHAFLELTVPTIQEGIQSLIDSGAKQIVVFPYFLAPGTHVVDDIPEIIERAKKDHAAISFSVIPHLGGVDGMVDLILKTASEA